MKNWDDFHKKMYETTIGIEVEMNNITRQAAAKIVAKEIGADGVYSAYHARGTYDTWEVKDTYGDTWKLMRDSSIVGDQLQKCELVTPILTYDDMDRVGKVLEALARAGAKSSPERGCGVHIHVGMTGHKAKTLRNLVNLVACHEDLLEKALNIEAGRLSRYCMKADARFLSELNTVKPETMTQLSEVWYSTQGGDDRRDWHYNRSRYHMLNLHSVFTKGTVEFRFFQFEEETGINADELRAYVQFCLALNQTAKEMATAGRKLKESAKRNPKYTMRTWLTRMGFIGEAYKTARAVFCRRLEGDSAYHGGRPHVA